MRNATAPGNPPPTSQTYSPSVPISLYREVVAELQAAQEMLDSLNSQNQQLIKQNQQLRQEIETVVHSAVHLQKVVDTLEPIRQNVAPKAPSAYREIPQEPYPPKPLQPIPNVRSIPSDAANVPMASPFATNDLPGTSGPSQPLFTEQPEGLHRRNNRTVRTSDLGGFWLIVTIILIVVSAFGAGYWIVRPLLMKR